MLVVSRKVGEEIVLADNIRLTVVAILGNRVRLGFTAPPEVPIRREELLPPAGDLADPSVPRKRTELPKETKVEIPAHRP